MPGAARLAALRALESFDPGRGLRRFPASAAAAIAGTFLLILDAYDVVASGETLDRALAGLAAFGLAALSVDLAAEGGAWRPARRWAALFAVAAAVAGVHLIEGPWRAHEIFLLPGLLGLVSVAGFAGRAADMDAFWRFNARTWLSAGLSVLAAGAFAIGLFAIDRSLDILFGINFEEIVENVVVPLAFGTLAPVAWLSAIPHPREAATLVPDPFVERAIRLLARLILVPLLLTYATILFAYALQIAVSWQMPEGRVGWMVSAFGTAGALATLLLHPERRSGGRLLRFFLRWWYWITAIPVALLLLALWQRIEAYGMTPPRYALGLCAAWLAALIALFARRVPDDRDMRLVPAIPAILLVLASSGPWGAAAVSVHSQLRELESLTAQQGWSEGRLLDTGALEAAATPRPGGRPPAIDRANDILDYLQQEEALDALARRYDNPEAFAALAAYNRWLARGLSEDLGLTGIAPPQTRRVVIEGPRAGGRLVDLPVLHGPFRVVALPPGAPKPEGPGRLAEGTLRIGVPGMGQVVIDFDQVVQESEKGEAVLPAYHVAEQPDGGAVGVLLVDAGGVLTPYGLDLHSVTVGLFTGPADAPVTRP